LTDIHRGIIRAFHDSWNSGLATLEMEDLDTGQITHVNCDNAPTVHALDAAFGNAIGPGHTVNPNGGYVGKTVTYETDEFGVLAWIAPVNPEESEQ